MAPRKRTRGSYKKKQPPPVSAVVPAEEPESPPEPIVLRKSNVKEDKEDDFPYGVDLERVSPNSMLKWINEGRTSWVYIDDEKEQDDDGYITIISRGVFPPDFEEWDFYHLFFYFNKSPKELKNLLIGTISKLKDDGKINFFNVVKEEELDGAKKDAYDEVKQAQDSHNIPYCVLIVSTNTLVFYDPLYGASETTEHDESIVREEDIVRSGGLTPTVPPKKRQRRSLPGVPRRSLDDAGNGEEGVEEAGTLGSLLLGYNVEYREIMSEPVSLATLNIDWDAEKMENKERRSNAGRPKTTVCFKDDFEAIQAAIPHELERNEYEYDTTHLNRCYKAMIEEATNPTDFSGIRRPFGPRGFYDLTHVFNPVDDIVSWSHFVLTVRSLRGFKNNNVQKVCKGVTTSEVMRTLQTHLFPTFLLNYTVLFSSVLLGLLYLDLIKKDVKLYNSTTLHFPVKMTSSQFSYWRKSLETAHNAMLGYKGPGLKKITK